MGKFSIEEEKDEEEEEEEEAPVEVSKLEGMQLSVATSLFITFHF